MYTAVKAVYDRKSKTYRPEVVENADLVLVHHGFLVYDHPAPTLERVKSGSLIGSWPAAKRAVVEAFLASRV